MKDTEIISDEPAHIYMARQELQKRMRKNFQYSLRSFAKKLGVDASLLSKVLSRKRKMSESLAKKIEAEMKLTEQEAALFWSSFRAPTISGAINLDHEVFSMIADPNHYALAELCRTKNFQSNVEWIAEELKVDSKKIPEIIKRLTQAGLIEVTENEIKRRKGHFTTADKSVTSASLKYHQKEILEKAISAMDEYPRSAREQLSLTIATNEKNIKAAKARMLEFLSEISSILDQKSDELTDVYHFTLSFFPAVTPKDLGQNSK